MNISALAKSLYEELLEMKFGVKRQEDPCAGPCGEICAEDPPACDQCKTVSKLQDSVCNYTIHKI